jgi:cytochrome c biogenesis protein CcdA
MLMFLLAYLGGLLTLLSPCVLPVLPFVFARPGVPFRRGGLPILLGMAVTFAVLSGLAAAGGAWLVGISQAGRYAAMALLSVMGLALIFPGLSDRLMRPFSRLGEKLQQRADRRGGLGGALLLGAAVGFLWSPCAGPILGLLLAGTALNGANLYSIVLLLAFALGAATSLGLALFAGERIFRLMKRGLGAEAWLRPALGVIVVAAVAVIALGWDTRFLSQFSFLSTARTEQALLARLHPGAVAGSEPGADPMPPISGATEWLNSPPLDRAMLRGKVVLVDFWTYSCINCLRTLPYLEAWDRKYRALGLVIIGVHSPEFAFEKNPRNVEQAVRELGIRYPVALDDQYAIWNAFSNRYWPAHYLVDARGYIRETHFGEGGYAETERMIQTLLKEASPGALAMGDATVRVKGSGAMAAAGAGEVERSPETYIGFAREQNLASPEAVARDAVAQYSAPRSLRPDQWALDGRWRVSAEAATAQGAGAAISYRFQGRDLHLVLGSGTGKPVRFRVTLDGAPPGASRGTDVDAQGNGIIREQRLYQLIRLAGDGAAHTFRIEFLDGSAQAYAFTFG